MRKRRDTSAVPTVALLSLGCPKNLVDSEKLLGRLAEDGFLPTDAAGGADLLVINTCSFIGEAQRESEQAIAAAIQDKARGRFRRLLVAGCHAQRFGARLAERFGGGEGGGGGGIDAIVGVSAAADISEAARRALDRNGSRRPWVRLHPPEAVAVADDARLRLTPRHWAYLRISEGCDHACTFCAIPSFRGKHRSKPIEQILREARELVASGASELLVIGEDTTAYGRDLEPRATLPDLLAALDGLAGVRWIRLMYAYPTGVDEATLSALTSLPRMAKYIDLPLQHTVTRVLKRMNRRETREQIFDLVARLRARVDGITIRSTFIAGFPGETAADHAQLLADLQALALDRVGCFAYSEEGREAANRLASPVPRGERARRRDALMARQQKVSWAANRARIGRVVQTVVDGPHPKARGGRGGRGGRGIWIGRTEGEAPEVDGHVEIRSQRQLVAGEAIQVRITHAGPYDLAGTTLD